MSGIISEGGKNRHTSGSIPSIILTRRMARGVIAVHMGPPTGLELPVLRKIEVRWQSGDFSHALDNLQTATGFFSAVL